jgi:methyl-accepting chemotaxis protein
MQSQQLLIAALCGRLNIVSMILEPLLGIIRILDNAADLFGNVNSLVDQTKQLEKHFDSVLSEVSAAIKTISSFVQDCDNAVHEIEAIAKQLPGAIAVAFDATLAKQEFLWLTH